VLITRNHIPEVAGIQPGDDTMLAQYGRREINTANAAAIVGPEADGYRLCGRGRRDGRVRADRCR
jgi:hypothetical protein